MTWCESTNGSCDFDDLLRSVSDELAASGLRAIGCDFVDFVLSPPLIYFSLVLTMFSLALHCSSGCFLLTWKDQGPCGPFCRAAKCSYNVLPVTQSRCFVDAVSQRTEWNV